jgi:tetratricopeptide (TPR) repeat protein
MRFLKRVILLSVALNVGCATSDKEVPKKHTEAIKAPQVVRKPSNIAKVEVQSTRTEKKLGWSCPQNLTLNPKETRESIIDKLNACVTRSQWGAVEKLADQLAVRYPDEPWGVYYLSISSHKQAKLDRAIWLIELAIKKSPKEGVLYYQRGLIYLGLGDRPMAAESMREAVKHVPELTDAHLYLAEHYYKQNDFKKALPHFDKIVALEPENLVGLTGLAEIYFQQKKWNEAQVALESAVRIAPKRTDIRLKLAELYEREKMYPLALASYQKVSDLTRGGKDMQLPFDLKDKIKALEPLAKPEATTKKVTQKLEE